MAPSEVAEIFPLERQDLVYFSQYHGDTKSQGINSHGINPVLPNYPSLNSRDPFY